MFTVHLPWGNLRNLIYWLIGIWRQISMKCFFECGRSSCLLTGKVVWLPIVWWAGLGLVDSRLLLISNAIIRCITPMPWFMIHRSRVMCLRPASSAYQWISQYALGLGQWITCPDCDTGTESLSTHQFAIRNTSIVFEKAIIEKPSSSKKPIRFDAWDIRIQICAVIYFIIL